MRIVSPERWWRALSAPLIAGLLGWGALPWDVASGPRLVVTCLAVAVGIWLAVQIMRTHLTVTDQGLADHRIVRVVRVPWQQVAGFEVARPGALWGGFCVTVVCSDTATVDLMSTRAYSRVPSARHLDELYRICWSLEEARPR